MFDKFLPSPIIKVKYISKKLSKKLINISCLEVQ